MATRRENGAGSKIVQEDNGRWKHNVSYRDTETDQSKRTTIRGESEKEVKSKVKELLKNIESSNKHW